LKQYALLQRERVIKLIFLASSFETAFFSCKAIVSVLQHNNCYLALAITIAVDYYDYTHVVCQEGFSVFCVGYNLMHLHVAWKISGHTVKNETVNSTNKLLVTKSC